MAKEEIAYLGVLPLFIGVESESWSYGQFTDVTIRAKSVGATSLLVKVADGTDVWYGGINGVKNVLSTIKTAGLNAIPYTYCYGNTYGGLTGEINILSTLLSNFGIAIADIETEFNNQPSWAASMNLTLSKVPGILGITTWANPNQQQWQNVLTELKPCVNFWLPQVYTDYLASIYKTQYNQFAVTYYPVLNLGTDFGPNNVGKIAIDATSEVLALWEYAAAVSSYSEIVMRLSQLFNNTKMTIPSGWQYDQVKKVLTAPNSIQVTDGFCQWILANAWDSDNFPLSAAVGLSPVEVGNQSLGGGVVQPFRKKVLVWTTKANVYEMWVGQEYMALYKERKDLQTQLSAAQTQITSLQKQIAALANTQQIVSVLQSAATESDQIANSATAIKLALQQIISLL